MNNESYGECPKHPGNSVVGCSECKLEEFMTPPEPEKKKIIRTASVGPKKDKAIVYALFGFNAEHAGCFSFNNYLQGLLINIRLGRLIYPAWEIVLQLDEASYLPHKALFDSLPVVLELNPDNEPLCRAMLWRLRPCFDPSYTHIICRDLDSPLTYRERQAVDHWISHDKTGHAITDSISHTIPLMGGMIGFRPTYFTMRTGFASWEDMLATTPLDFKTKGDDQTFLNHVIYPKIAGPGNDSITQHYVLGMGNTFLSDYHNHIPDIAVDLPADLRDSNNTCGHIGAAGFYPGPTFKFLHRYKDQMADLREVEKNYPRIFYWDEEI